MPGRISHVAVIYENGKEVGLSLNAISTTMDTVSEGFNCQQHYLLEE